MVELENDVRIVRRLRIVLERRVPPAGIPFPANPGVVEPVADGDDIAGLQRVSIID